MFRRAPSSLRSLVSQHRNTPTTPTRRSGPEVYSGESSPSGASDVFAFGLILYQIYTREEVFADLVRAGEPVKSILFMVNEGDLRPKFYVRDVPSGERRLRAAARQQPGGGPKKAEGAPASAVSRRGRLLRDGNGVEVWREIRDLAADCWHRNPVRRPSFPEVKQELQRILEARRLLFFIFSPRSRAC